VQIKRREQEFLFATVKREKKGKIKQNREGGKEKRRKQEEARKRGQNQRGHCFFSARTSSQRLGAATAVPSPSLVSAPDKSMHSLCFAF